jgi:peroxiredoxin
MAAPSPGDRAPAFRLRRTFDEDVSLDDLLARGPCLLVFYVFDFGHA